MFQENIIQAGIADMASLKDLYNVMASSDLANKVASAIIIACDAIRQETGNPQEANRRKFAKLALRNPEGIRVPMLRAIVGRYNTFAVGDETTPNTLLGANDTQIQNAVNDAIPLFADGSDF